MENEKKPESSRRRMVRKVNLGQDKIKLDLSREYGLVLEGGLEGAQGSRNQDKGRLGRVGRGTQRGADLHG